MISIDIQRLQYLFNHRQRVFDQLEGTPPETERMLILQRIAEGGVVRRKRNRRIIPVALSIPLHDKIRRLAKDYGASHSELMRLSIRAGLPAVIRALGEIKKVEES